MKKIGKIRIKSKKIEKERKIYENQKKKNKK